WEMDQFGEPNDDCDELLGIYTKSEDKAMNTAFGCLMAAELPALSGVVGYKVGTVEAVGEVTSPPKVMVFEIEEAVVVAEPARKNITAHTQIIDLKLRISENALLLEKKLDELKEECYTSTFAKVGAFSTEQNFIRGDPEGISSLVEGISAVIQPEFIARRAEEAVEKHTIVCCREIIVRT
ncbi:hypothetical protein ACJX0J_036967, partial [Zea mays]